MTHNMTLFSWGKNPAAMKKLTFQDADLHDLHQAALFHGNPKGPTSNKANGRENDANFNDDVEKIDWTFRKHQTTVIKSRILFCWSPSCHACVVCMYLFVLFFQIPRQITTFKG